MASLLRSHFNPRSHTGSDISTPTRVLVIIYFNPRSHTGSDKIYLTKRRNKMISIHAPTRGATYSYRRRWWFSIISIHAPTRGATAAFTAGTARSDFNPRSHTGSDPISEISFIGYFSFQSTLPHGERLSMSILTKD